MVRKTAANPLVLTRQHRQLLKVIFAPESS
jgi:hypothetical protein